MKKYDKRFIIGYIINKEARLESSKDCLKDMIDKIRKEIIK
tara:strand:- start:1456 stop:1578 length:123 start_codon:yes stop_codon:yes gene_type:complete